jgi:diguanylate cyclase (GGDEF)-like protein/PAS domain S-box-containing protein
MTSPPADPAAPAVASAARADRAMHRWVRAAMYLAFLALALATAFQGWQTWRLDRQGAADTEIVDRASLMRLHTQTIARHAALLLAPDASGAGVREAALVDLETTLFAAADAALGLQRLLGPQREDTGAAGLAAAEEAWEAARERLWYRAHGLLHAVERGDVHRLAAAVAAVQGEAERANAAARTLQSVLRDAADARRQRMDRMLVWQVALLLLLLAVLAMVVVEPTARAVKRQVKTLEQQALDLRRLALVAENTAALVVVSDRDDRVLWVNPAFTRVTGWTPQEAAGALPGDLVHHPGGAIEPRAALRAALADGHGLRTEMLCRRRDGSDLWLDVDLRPVHDARGEVVGFVSVSSDISARVAEQRKLQLLWAALPAGVVVQSADGDVVDANRAAARLLGLNREQMIGRNAIDARWSALRDDGSPYPGAQLPAMRTLATGVALANETMGIRLPDGSLRWLLVNTEPQRDEQGQVVGVISCFTDVTERRLLQERLRESARTDSLTGLPNRAVVLERLTRALEHAQAHPGYGFAVLFMDFDRFKQVNDTLGHGAGDELLRQIAERLRRSLRPGDAIARVDNRNYLAARLGGDEFVIVLDGVHEPATVRAVADRLLAEMAEPYTVGDHPVQSSASIGVVISSLGGESAEELLRNADTAMYEAKRAGRGRWVLFDPSMHARLVHTLAVEHDLRRALREDELFVVYQPVVELGSGRLAGVEALVRWRHPQRGLVPPAEFVAIAEECGLIADVGRRVLAKAAAQFMRWRRELGASAPQQLAVNLSRAQLERPSLVGDVMQALLEAGMAPQALQFEVTESLAAQDERVQATLRELKARGIRLALDDFGTGYSSLACLHQLPVDTVKIDRSFVHHAETVEYHRVLIEATIRVARTLGMTTVAEGIETPGEAALMRALACDRGQGWLFGRPMLASDVEAWVREHDGAAALA